MIQVITLCPWQSAFLPSPLHPHQLEKVQKAASAAHTYFVANPSHLEMRNNIEKYRRMKGVTAEAFQDREIENEKHWVSREQWLHPYCTLLYFDDRLSLSTQKLYSERSVSFTCSFTGPKDIQTEKRYLVLLYPLLFSKTLKFSFYISILCIIWV